MHSVNKFQLNLLSYGNCYYETDNTDDDQDIKNRRRSSHRGAVVNEPD